MKKAIEKTHNPIAEAPVDPPPEQPSDGALLDAVTQALRDDGRLDGESFDVVVEDGCAVLSGAISREYLRVLVDALVGSVPGILVVKNQLHVRQSGPMAKAGK